MSPGKKNAGNLRIGQIRQMRINAVWAIKCQKNYKNNNNSDAAHFLDARGDEKQLSNMEGPNPRF